MTFLLKNLPLQVNSLLLNSSPALKWKKKKGSMNVTEFILMGLTQKPQIKITLFLVLFILYITVTGNLLIVVIIICSLSLNSAMYFFMTFCLC